MFAKATRLLGFTALSIWMVAETLWFPYYLFTVRRLQRTRPVHHATEDSQARKDLILKCWDALETAARPDRKEEDIQAFLSGWFLGAPFAEIKRENLKSWVAWAFLDRDYTKEEDDEGRGESLRAMRYDYFFKRPVFL